MSALLVAGAPVDDIEPYRTILGDAVHLVAVDRGADLCRALGYVPDLYVGDGDSVRSDTLERLNSLGVECVMLDRDKDMTDLSVALEEAHARFGGPVDVTAIVGGRADHFLVAVGDLMDARGVVRVVENGQNGWVLNGAGATSVTLSPAGTIVSVIAGPLGARVTLDGFRWPLEADRLEPLSGRGLGNVIESSAGTVTLHDGAALVFAPRGADEVCVPPLT